MPQIDRPEGRLPHDNCQLASNRPLHNIEAMDKHLWKVGEPRPASKNGTKNRHRRYEIAGKTSDGVTILRGPVKATHFTRKQIRDAIIAVVGPKG
jgi:hypothetical protein